MKNMLITFGIGLVVSAALIALLFFVLTTGTGIVVLGIITFLALSYLVGWLIRDVWDMREYW